MNGLFAILAALSIEGGSLMEVLQGVAPSFDAQMIFEQALVDGYRSPGVHCRACTVEMAMEQALAGTPFRWSFDTESESLFVCLPADFYQGECFATKCRPELGAQAPLPPCVGKSLEIRPH